MLTGIPRMIDWLTVDVASARRRSASMSAEGSTASTCTRIAARVASSGSPSNATVTSTATEAMAASNELSSALARLLVVVERYPELKADQTFLRLQDELAGTENRLAVARMRYNDAARAYNTTAKRFPTLVTARIFGFDERPYFEAPAEAKEAPEVEF